MNDKQLESTKPNQSAAAEAVCDLAGQFSVASQSPRCLLVCGASWCASCQAMLPDIRQIIAEGYEVRIADVDRHIVLARYLCVRSVPEVMVVEEPDDLFNYIAVFRPGPGRKSIEELRSIVRAWNVTRNR